MTRKRRWIDVLRRSTEFVSGGGASSRAIDDAALATLHTRAQELLRDGVQTVERLAGATTRHRATIEALLERQRMLASRIADLRAAVGRLAEAQGRLGVVALNAGLEGARIEGAAGRALVMVADEVRTLLSRAAGAANELGGTVEELGGEVVRLEGQIGEAKTSGGVVAEEASRALRASHEADAALSDLGDQLRRATGVDPELAAAVERAQSHARDLVAALTVVSSRAQGSLAAAALRPVIEPLGRLLDQLDTGDAEDKE